MTIPVRFVRITFSNGCTLTGVVPATVTDEEIASLQSDGVTVVFSDPYQTPRQAPVARLLEIGQQAEQRLAS